MKALNKKLGKNSGFTLVEMLIVVAIIAILIAISIPLVGSALENARDATDKANERSAKAEALIIYLDAGVTESDAYGWLTRNAGAVYNNVTGKFQANIGNATDAYGQCTQTGDAGFAGQYSADRPSSAATAQTGKFQAGGANGHSGCALVVRLTTTGDVVLNWVPGDKLTA